MVDPAIGRVNAAITGSRSDEALLDAALAALGHRREGYRLRRSGPRQRLADRARSVGLDVGRYLTLLRASSAERAVARRLVALSTTRLHRDPGLWALLAGRVLPTLAASGPETRIWVAEAGTAGEAFLLSMLWSELSATRERAERPVRIVATDARDECLERATSGRLAGRAARGLPAVLLDRYLRPAGDEFVVGSRERSRVALAPLDLARDPWPFQVHMIVMRNSIFTLWGEALVAEAVERAASSLIAHGWLVLGRSESLGTRGAELFQAIEPGIPLYRKRN